MKNIRKIGRGLAQHIVDTTALNAAANPIIGGLEVTAFGMSDEVSFNARIFASVVGYLGVASLISRGRDYSRSLFKITDKTSEKIQQVHDGAFIAAFNGFFCPIMYTYSGETDVKKIIYGTLGAMAVGSIFGGTFGYSIDTFRDLIGLKSCERESYPELIKKRKSSVKKGIAGLLIGTSIGINAGIYALTPDNHNIENLNNYEMKVDGDEK